MFFQNSIGIDIHVDRICIAWLKSSAKGLFFSGVEVVEHEWDHQANSLTCLDEIISEFKKRHSIESFDLYLGIPDEGCLIKTVELPFSVKDEIGAVLNFEIEKYIPMPASEVDFRFRVLREDKSSDIVSVLLQVIKKERLNPLIGLKDYIPGGLTGIMLTSCAVEEQKAFLASGGKIQAKGVEPMPDMDSSSVSGAAALALQKFNPRKNRINFLPERFRKKPSRIPMAVFIFLLSLNLIALMVMGASFFVQDRIQNRQLDEKLTRFKQQALKAQTLEQRVESLELKGGEITGVMVSRPSMLEILNELSSITPMDTHLKEFEFKKNTIWIKGMSTNASRLIGIYEASDYFSNAGFESKISIKEDRQETFVIKMLYGGKDEK